MKFSIIIPLHNKQDTIRRAVFSVIDQLVNQHELIIIDDGSTDNSLNIVNQIKSSCQEQIHIHSQKNAGVSAARNKGIKLASNDYLCFLDADDSYEANFLSEIANMIKRYPKAAMFSTAYRFVDTHRGTQRNANLVGLSSDKDQQLLNDFFFSAANGDLPVTSSSVCIKKSALLGIGGFPENENMGEDQSVWSQIALHHPIAISTKVSANYFENTTDSLMQTVPPTQEMPFSQRLQNQLNNNQIPKKFEQSVKQYLAGHLLDLIRRNTVSGQLSTAQSLLADTRCRTHYARWCYWRVKTIVAQLARI